MVGKEIIDEVDEWGLLLTSRSVIKFAFLCKSSVAEGDMDLLASDCVLSMDELISFIDCLESDKDAKVRVINYLWIIKNWRTDYTELKEIFSP